MPSRNTIEIEIKAEDHASGTIRSTSGSLDKFGGSLARIAEFAIGGLIVGGLQKIGGAIAGLGREALTAVASHERLGMALESLVARELMRNSGIEKTIVTGKARLQLTGKEIAEISKLEEKLRNETLARNTLGAQIQEEKERIRQLTLQYGENGLTVQTHKAKLEQMKAKFEDLGVSLENVTGRLGELSSKEGKLVTVTKKVIEGQLSMKDALAQAGPKAKELINWIEKLAILSPFTEDDVAQAFRLTMQYGFTVDEAKRLTQALIDLAAGSGATGETMQRIALAIGQIEAKGKLTGEEVRQLTEAGFNVRDALLQAGTVAGLTAENFDAMQSKGLIPARKAIEAIVITLEKDFGGAAKRQAGTFSGLISSLSDIKKVGLREFFTGMFTAIQPYLDKLVTLFTEGGLKDKIREFGDTLGKFITDVIPKLKESLSPIAKVFADLAAGNVESAMSAFAAGIGEILRHLAGMDPKKALDVAVAVNQFGQGMIDSAQGFASFAAAAADAVWQTTLDWFLVNGDALKDDLNGIADGFKNLGEKLGTAGESAKTAGPAVTGVLAGLTTVGLDQIAIALDTIAKALPEVNRGLETLGGWTGANLGPIRDTNGELNLWGQNIAALQYQLLLLGSPMTKMQQDMQNWQNLTNLLRQELGKLPGTVKAASDAMVKMKDEFVKAIWAAWADLTKWFNGVSTKMEEAGADIVAGIKRGISENWDAFIKWIESKIGSIIDAIKDALGIKHSPSELTKPMGADLALGILAGFNQAIGQVRAGIAAATGGLTGIGAPAPAYAFAGGGAGRTPFAPASLGVTGDTYYVTVTDRLAAAMLLSNVRDRQRRRLNVGMGG